MSLTNPIHIQIYTWDGQWGPFRIKVRCGECSLTKDIVHNLCKEFLSDIPTKISIDPWLDNWWRVLPKGGWHAPIVLVDGCVISQGEVIERDRLIHAVIRAHGKSSSFSTKGWHIYGKKACPFCQKAVILLQNKKLLFTYRDVIQEPRALFEMLARVKPIIGHQTLLTVPQIFLGQKYIGTYNDLVTYLEKTSTE